MKINRLGKSYGKNIKMTLQAYSQINTSKNLVAPFKNKPKKFISTDLTDHFLF